MLAQVPVMVLPRLAGTYPRKAVLPPAPMECPMLQDELVPWNRTAVGRYTTLASSSNRARKREPESRHSDHSGRGTSAQTSTPSRKYREPQPSRHNGASP